jgi:hydrogenase nickel incorporation protein HypA/HybF
VHELSITQAVIDAVIERMGETPIGKVTLEIGKLSGVVPDSVRFCFEVVVDGTSLAGAALDVIEPPGHARCRDCSTEFDVDDPILLCTSCGSANVAVLSGAELRIRSVEVREGCVRPAAVPTTPESG